MPRPVSSSPARDGVDTRLDEECGRPDCQQIALTASEVYCDITGGLLLAAAERHIEQRDDAHGVMVEKLRVAEAALATAAALDAEEVTE